jgi:hypothetical protein
VLKSGVLRRIFGPKRDEITGEWGKLNNVEPNYLYSSPNIVRVIKLKRTRSAGQVACLWERRGIYRVWWGNQKERGDLEGTGIDGRIIF